ncbi:hypothetical protein [Pseudomonas sp. 273]|uniref:hypothetical protein n=1 Tax=Pseudomonas sp. 273 TaxID=75692 RepID=UPI0023D80C65|nr:hypothetical protein [Pseudomonas sp. 273]
MSRQMTARRLSRSEMNHLRRLIAWVRCEVGAQPEEIITTVHELAPQLGDISEDAKQRLAKWHQRAEAVPQYVRAAIKALEKVAQEEAGETVEGELGALIGKEVSA